MWYIFYSQVRCGAIGCEMLKNFALLGVGTGKEKGMVRYKSLRLKRLYFSGCPFLNHIWLPGSKALIFEGRALGYKLDESTLTIFHNSCNFVANYLSFLLLTFFLNLLWNLLYYLPHNYENQIWMGFSNKKAH